MDNTAHHAGAQWAVYDHHLRCHPAMRFNEPLRVSFFSYGQRGNPFLAVNNSLNVYIPVCIYLPTSEE